MSHKHETLSTTSSNSNGNLNKQMDDTTQSETIELNNDYESMDLSICSYSLKSQCFGKKKSADININLCPFTTNVESH